MQAKKARPGTKLESTRQLCQLGIDFSVTLSMLMLEDGTAQITFT